MQEVMEFWGKMRGDWECEKHSEVRGERRKQERETCEKNKQ